MRPLRLQEDQELPGVIDTFFFNPFSVPEGDHRELLQCNIRLGTSLAVPELIKAKKKKQTAGNIRQERHGPQQKAKKTQRDITGTESATAGVMVRRTHGREHQACLALAATVVRLP